MEYYKPGNDGEAGTAVQFVETGVPEFDNIVSSYYLGNGYGEVHRPDQPQSGKLRPDEFTRIVVSYSPDGLGGYVRNETAEPVDFSFCPDVLTAMLKTSADGGDEDASGHMSRLVSLLSDQENASFRNWFVLNHTYRRGECRHAEDLFGSCDEAEKWLRRCM